MPIGYLITVTVPALLTVVTLANVRDAPLFLRQLRWRLTFQLNELPVLVACWVLAATALAAAQGNLITPVGGAGALVAAATLTGLLLVLQRGLQAGPAAVRALDEGCDELFDRWQARFPSLVGRRGRWCGRKALVQGRLAPDDLCSLLCEV